MPRASAAAKRPYHHGNLRAALIDAGLELIAEKGVRALTLREIGTRVGVSRTAAYRHFQDKETLLEAISEAGFEQFAAALQTAKDSAGPDCAKRLRAMGAAYVRFAAQHPAYFEVMFGGLEKGDKPIRGSGAGAFAILENTIREGQEQGAVRDGDTALLARVVWAQVHGISTLCFLSDSRSGPGGAKTMQLSSEVLECGLLTPSARSAS